MTLKIVSENSSEELAQNAAMEKVGRTLRNHAANILRVTRGAGKPWELGQQAQDFVQSLLDYHEATGAFPSSYDLTAALDVDQGDDYLSQFGRDEYEKALAERSMINGALQIAASRMLGQKTQQAAGQSELYDGVRDIENLRDKWRRERSSAGTKTKAERKKAASKRRSKKPSSTKE